MLRFLRRPGLPEGEVKTVALGGAGESEAGGGYVSRLLDEVAQSLGRHGIEAVRLGSDSRLAAPVSYHTDLLMCHLGCSEQNNDNRFVFLSEKCKSDFVNYFTKSDFEQGSGITEIAAMDTSITDESIMPISDKYPGDIALCTLILGNTAFGFEKATEPAILRFCNENGIKLINCAQGYAKCSVCVVSASAAITTDAGLGKLLGENGFDTLFVRPDGIELDGYGYGFIGGASGLISPDKLAFTGRIDHMVDADEIYRFLDRHAVEPVFLTDRRIFDAGSIIPIAEWV